MPEFFVVLRPGRVVPCSSRSEAARQYQLGHAPVFAPETRVQRVVCHIGPDGLVVDRVEDVDPRTLAR